MFKIKPYVTSKTGESFEQCQDALGFNHSSNRFAVADGATREFFSKKIAQELVNRFCLDDDLVNNNIFTTKNYEDWLRPMQDKWLKFIEEIVNNKEKKVSLYVNNRFKKRAAGASTFVGLELSPDTHIFKAMVIGDSCLFHIRNNEILKSYLLEDPKQFSSTPDLFFSRTSNNMIPIRKFSEPKIIDEPYIKGDYFILASDAISKYFLEKELNGEWNDLWKNLLVSDDKWYGELIIEARKHSKSEEDAIKLEDDDVAILIIATSSENKLRHLSTSGIRTEILNMKITDTVDPQGTESLDEEENDIDSLVNEIKIPKVEFGDKVEFKSENSGDKLTVDLQGTENLDKKENNIDSLVNETKIPKVESGDKVEFKSEDSGDKPTVDLHGTESLDKEENDTDRAIVKNQKIVLLVCDEEERELGGCTQIEDTLRKQNMVLQKYKEGDIIKETNGILILSERKNVGGMLWNKKFQTTWTYYLFDKERKDKYEFRKEYKVYIKEQGIITQQNLIEVVGSIKQWIEDVI